MFLANPVNYIPHKSQYFIPLVQKLGKCNIAIKKLFSVICNIELKLLSNELIDRKSSFLSYFQAKMSKILCLHLQVFL